MKTIYSAIEDALGMDQGTFDSCLFSSPKATEEIKDCLLHCFKNVPELRTVAAYILQYALTKEHEREDGGPGSGNFEHAGVIGQLGGSAPSDAASAEDGQIRAELRPSSDSYVEADGVQNFIHRNVEALRPIYEEKGMSACEAEYYKMKMEKSTTDLHELSEDDAAEIIYDNLDQHTFDGWMREANSAYKPRIVDSIISSPEMRNAALNTMYENYKFFNEKSTISYDEFINTPVEMYRGGHGQEHIDSDIFSSYTFNKGVAEKFAGDNGTVYTVKIRPIDTYGSLVTTGESEIFVPSEIAPNGNMDSREDGGPGSGNFGHAGVPGQVGGSAPGNGSRESVDGKDITGSYTGETDIKSVLKAQGFDGLPKVVSKEEFDEAVKASNFIAQRTYVASSKEVLDAYRSQLYNGEWYVECDVGGAQYGQGMYCASDYNGELTDGIKAEMEWYQELGDDRIRSSGLYDYVSSITKEEIMANENCKDDTFTDKQISAFIKMTYDPYANLDRLSDDERSAYKSLSGGERMGIALALDEITEDYRKNRELPSAYTETMTLTPDARVVTFDEINSRFTGSLSSLQSDKIKSDVTEKVFKDALSQYSDDEKTFISYNAKPGEVSWEDVSKAASGMSSERMTELTKIGSEIKERANAESQKAVDRAIDEVKANRGSEKFSDVGSYAAALGYDAINAEGHGKSGSYTVILNRTKTIILNGRANTDSTGDSVIYFQQGEDGVIYAIQGKKVIGWVTVAGAPSEKSNEGGGPDSGNFNLSGAARQHGGSASRSAAKEDSNDSYASQLKRLGALFQTRRAELKTNIHEKLLDFSGQKATIKSKGIQKDGGPGSGNFGHSGVPGQVGGSSPQASARGENVECVGFANDKKQAEHIRKHLKEFPGMSGNDYVTHAKQFLSQPCSETVDGYLTKDGEVVRFDRTTGEYAKGTPGGALKTCFLAKYNRSTGKVNLKAANNYFAKLKEAEGVSDE